MCGRIWEGISDYAQDVYWVTTGSTRIPTNTLPWRFPYFRNDYGTMTDTPCRVIETGEMELNPDTGLMERVQRIEWGAPRMDDVERWENDMESRREIRVWVPITLLVCLAGIALVLVIHKYAIKKP